MLEEMGNSGKLLVHTARPDKERDVEAMDTRIFVIVNSYTVFGNSALFLKHKHFAPFIVILKLWIFR